MVINIERMIAYSTNSSWNKHTQQLALQVMADSNFKQSSNNHFMKTHTNQRLVFPTDTI